jgi:surface protein
MSPIRNFSINFGTNAFSGTVYIADADHGVLDFAISVGANTFLNVWTKANLQPRTSNAFLKVIGIVITSNPNHRSIIENYFGSKSQNLKYSNAASLENFWITESNNSFFACRVSSFPLLNTQNVTSIVNTWYQCTSLTSFPLLNTQNVTSMTYTWRLCTSLTSFPLLNTQNVTSMYGAWFKCSSLTLFPSLNTQNVTNMFGILESCTSLTSLPSLNTRNVTNMAYAWYQCTSLTQLSLDNILISIAAGFANNLSKNSIDVTNIFNSVPAILTHENRRPINNPEDIQDTISNWNAIIDNYLNGGIILTEMRTQHANAIDTYNIKWKSWEQALRSTNESLNGVQYNFSNGTVSGQKARFWILAKKSLNIPLGAAPTTLTTEVTRSYRSNSGLTVSGSNVNTWTPVTGTSNQTISGLTTQTINGITCVMFSSEKTITLDFSSINGVTNTENRVYIGTLYGYVKITPPNATNLKISTNTTTELPIISIMVTTTAVNETEVLLRLGFYGSFQEFNYTTNNNLASANIQLTAV